MTENEFILQDRIGVIKSIDKKYDLNKNAYISFSGGKDSTILHYLVDMALPNNQIPRVFADTGIEYQAISLFVREREREDSRFTRIKPSFPVSAMLKKYGYPFKSKEHSHILNCYQNSGVGKSVLMYLGKQGNKLIKCPKSLEYQFSEEFKIKVSDQCCLRMKKKPFLKWAKENNRPIFMTGMRIGEGGERAALKGCVITDKDGNLKKFHPLAVVSEEWEEWFIKEFNIKLCELYYPPFNFKRTGCKGCPFSVDLQEQLTLMELYLPNERKQCEMIWKVVYDEYRRIGFRLDKNEQLKLF